MISQTPEDIRIRAEKWIKFLGQGELVAGRSTVGGGSLPGATLPTWLVAIKHPHLNKIISGLRMANPPIIARLEEDRLVMDPRSVLKRQDDLFLKNVKSILIN
jgi:L-seryl-tRNA(Ser) seleniumtransferase